MLLALGGLPSLGTLLLSREQIFLLLICLCCLGDWIVDVIKTKIAGKQHGV